MSTPRKTLLFLFVYFYISNIFIQNAYAILESGDNLDDTNYEVRTFDVSDEENTPRDVTFSNDGKKMFIAGRSNKKVFEYSLSVNFDVSEAEYTGNFIDVSAQVASVFLGLAFSHDGTMMYVTDGQKNESTDSIYQFSLNKSFDLSGGANLLRSVKTTTEGLETLLPEENEPNGIAFNKSGTRMFLVGTKGNDVNQYTLSEAFNISTASFDGGAGRAGADNPNGIDFSPDGLIMYLLDTFNREVQEHHLPCPFNLLLENVNRLLQIATV